MSTATPASARLAQALRALEQRWSTLSVREQTMTWAAIVIVSISLLWLILLEPAIKTIAALEANLPLAVNQASQAQSLSADIQKIKGTTSKAIVQAGGARAVIDRTLTELGWANNTEIKNNASGTVHITVKNVGAKAAFEWLDNIAKQPGIRLESVQLNKISPGVVDIVVNATLADQATP